MYVYNRMITLRLTWVITLLIIMSSCGSSVVIAPENKPVAAGEREQQLLLQGEQYFKQGKIETSLQKVQQAHALNPDNEEALYAIAKCYSSLKQYSKSLQYSRRAASYRSEHLPEIYLLMGRTYQQLDQPWDALRTLRYAASHYPDNFKLQYALGDVYVYLGKIEFAGDAFKKAIAAAPDDAASHYRLGILYHTNRYDIPALLALSITLMLEPKHARTPSVRQNIANLLARDLESNNTDEGDFHAMQVAINRQRVSMQKSADKDSDFEIIRAQYLTLYEKLDTETNRNQEKGFVFDTYMPFYRKLYHQGLAETSVYYMFQNNREEAIDNWLKQNAEKVKMLDQLVASIGSTENDELRD